jgi:clan AA aspartic protease
MIIGMVNGYCEAIISLVVAGPKESEQEVDAVVDTGFDGSLSLPPTIITALDLPYRQRGRAILADGSETLFNIYEATVNWDGQPRRIKVDDADTDPLAGMELLYGHKLEIAVVEGGSVIINVLPKFKAVA